MYVFTLDSNESYVDFVDQILRLDQPLYLYDSPIEENKILVSPIEVDEEDIDNLINHVEQRNELDDLDDEFFDFDDPDDEFMLYF